jgi:CheY-like chemotaxis protein
MLPRIDGVAIIQPLRGGGIAMPALIISAPGEIDDRVRGLRAGDAAGVAPLLRATRNVTIVFVLVADPVGAGFVDSLAHPGGNAIGFVAIEYGFAGFIKPAPEH